MQKYQNNVQTIRGTAIRGAAVRVTTTAGVLATLYSDNGVTVQANPIITGADGEYAFYAANGRYSLSVTAAGYQIDSVTDFALDDVHEVLVANVAALNAAQVALDAVQGDLDSVAGNVATAVDAASAAEISAAAALDRSVDAALSEYNAGQSANSAAADALDIHTNWSDKLATAAAQAGIATTGAGTATTQAGISTAQAVLAVSAKTAAELARDASFALGPKYTTEALGRAAVADGVNFLVQGSGEVAAYEYRRINAGTVSTLIATYPSKAAYDALTARLANDEMKTRFTRSGYMRSSDGILTVDATWLSTELLPVGDVVIGALSLYGHTNVSSIAFYNSSKAFISGVSAAVIGDYVTTYPALPANAAFVTFSCSVTNFATQVFNVASRPTAMQELRAVAIETQNLFTRQGYLNASGVLVVDANWGATELIEISRLTLATLSLYGHTIVSSIAFYDSVKTFISKVSAAAVGTQVTTYPAPPANAVYVAFTCNYQYPSGQVFSARVTKPTLVNGILDINYAKYATQPGYITVTGTESASDANWLRSDFLLLPAGTVAVCDMVGHTAACSIAFYTSGKVFISGQSASSGVMPGAVFQSSVTAPAGTVYCRISYGNPATYAVAAGRPSRITINTDLTGKIIALETAAQVPAAVVVSAEPYASMRKLKLLTTDKVLLFGDSISSTDYPWYKTAMENLTGAVIYNGGFSGATSAQLAANVKMQRIYDYGARLVIAMVGGNDTGAAGTVGTFNGGIAGEATVAESSIAGDYVGTCFIQSVSHIIRKFQAQYSDIRARAGLTGSEDEATKTAMIDAVLKPVLAFATPLPQKRNNSGDAFSQAANWKRKRDAVVECCAKYKIHCVDLYSKNPWDMAAEPYWVSPTVMTTNNGIYTMDGLHPNKYGYQVVAEIVCAEIGL